MSNIFPVFDRMLTQEDKENSLRQKGTVLWFTGLSGSGKSTIALALDQALYAKGKHTVLLDGDNIRSGVCNNLGFSMEDRAENIRRISEVAKLFVNNGTITLCSFVSPTVKIRASAQEIIGENFNEIFVNTPLEVCEERDVKGLYKKARAGLIKDFSGIDSPFEPSENPALTIDTTKTTVDQAVDELLRLLNL